MGGTAHDGPGLNLAGAFRALAESMPDHPCLVVGEMVLTNAAMADRAGRLAGVLHGAGLGCSVERDRLAGWECGQSVVGLMLYNGHEYLESMLGAYAARCAPANFNWRSTPDELAYLITDAKAESLVYDRALADVVGAAMDLLDDSRRPAVLLEVGGGRVVPGSGALAIGSEGEPAVARARAYEAALAEATPVWLDGPPDDLYILYTGGTTGRPKGTLWRQADFVVGALGVRHSTIAAVLAAVAGSTSRLVSLPAPPLIHGAAQWNVWSAWLGGGTVVFPGEVRHFDPVAVLAAVERERVTSLQIVGDAFGRPLLAAIAAGDFDLGSLRFLTSGGTGLSTEVRDALQAALPGVTVLDIMGSSEAGRLAVATFGAKGSSGFVPSGKTTVVTESRDALVPPRSAEIGWLATTGAIPLGYLGDRAKTESTFPVIDGRRYSVPGDRARWAADGSVDILGRDASVINTGGEKVFAEEVEVALTSHPAVDDALVVGRPHAVLGNEVCAVIAINSPVDLEQLRAHLASTLARYKLPRHLAIAARIERSPAGKPDYAWARRIVIVGEQADG